MTPRSRAARAPGERPGLTPPRRRGGSGRFITDHIVELGFAAREQVDGAIAEARTSGMTPEQVLLQSEVDHDATSSRGRPPSASGSTTST